MSSRENQANKHKRPRIAEDGEEQGGSKSHHQTSSRNCYKIVYNSRNGMPQLELFLSLFCQANYSQTVGPEDEGSFAYRQHGDRSCSPKRSVFLISYSFKTRRRV